MKWLPIESAPRDGTYVDLWMCGPNNSKGARVTDCWFGGGWLKDYGRDGEDTPEIMVGDKPTHWMPLPEPPSEGK